MVDASAQGDAGDIECFNFTLELGAELVDLDTDETETVGGFLPCLGEDVGLGTAACQFSRLDLDHVPGSVLRFVAVAENNVIITLNHLATGSLDHLVHLLSIISGCLDDGFDHGQSRYDTSLEVLATKHNTSGLGEKHHGLGESQRDITCTSLGVELSKNQGLRSTSNNVRAPTQLALLHCAGDLGCKDGLGVLADILVDVEVLHGVKLAVHSLVPLFVVAKRSGRAKLVSINSNVRVEISDQGLDITSLLASKSNVISVGIVSSSKDSLKQRKKRLIPAWFISMNSAL
ncbi:hypothetical protein HG531_010614 [Fusarium graminearum]|nr:hypothetical protein HG531_010614 [Fusarium graminearum]